MSDENKIILDGKIEKIVKSKSPNVQSLHGGCKKGKGYKIAVSTGSCKGGSIPPRSKKIKKNIKKVLTK